MDRHQVASDRPTHLVKRSLLEIANLTLHRGVIICQLLNWFRRGAWPIPPPAGRSKQYNCNLYISIYLCWVSVIESLTISKKSILGEVVNKLVKSSFARLASPLLAMHAVSSACICAGSTPLSDQQINNNDNDVMLSPPIPERRDCRTVPLAITAINANSGIASARPMSATVAGQSAKDPWRLKGHKMWVAA